MSEQPEAGQTGGRSAPWSLVAALAVLLVLAVAVAGWLAIDGDDDEPGADGTTAPSSATDASTFEQDGVPFTFDYPSSFATSEPPRVSCGWRGSARSTSSTYAGSPIASSARRG